MPLQIQLLGEFGGAHSARVRHYTGMRALVSNEVYFVSKSFATDGASVGLLGRVNKFVFDNVRALSKLLAADAASVGPLARVNAFVFDELCLLGERPATGEASMRLLTGMDIVVSLQV